MSGPNSGAYITNPDTARTEARQRIRGAEYIYVPTVDQISTAVDKSVRDTLNDRDSFLKVEYRDIIGIYQADGSGNLNTAEEVNQSNADQTLGPNPGFIWDVLRLVIVNNSGGNVGSVGVFKNNGQPSGLVLPGTTCPELFSLGSQRLVLKGNDVLYFVGTGLGANNYITVTGQVKEVPLSYAGRLNL